ncbi:MAG: hypothetical protein RIE59_09830 [Imperialibacter sp.]
MMFFPLLKEAIDHQVNTHDFTDGLSFNTETKLSAGGGAFSNKCHIGTVGCSGEPVLMPFFWILIKFIFS